jgi:hypothetical protein
MRRRLKMTLPSSLFRRAGQRVIIRIIRHSVLGWRTQPLAARMCAEAHRLPGCFLLFRLLGRYGSHFRCRFYGGHGSGFRGGFNRCFRSGFHGRLLRSYYLF